MPNIATINDKANNLTWRTALNETTGITYKVVVKSLDGTVSGYANFVSAYAAAITGDSIYLNSGTHDCGSVTFSLSKSVNIIGSGTTNCIINANGFITTSGFQNCVISDIKFTHFSSNGTSLFIFGNSNSDTLNVEFNNVHFISSSTSATHALDITGIKITFNNILVESNKANVFRLRGSSNIRIKGLELKYINSTSGFIGKYGLYLHASTATGAIIDDVTIDDLKIEQPWKAGIYLKVLNSNTEIKNLHINNVIFNLNSSNTTANDQNGIFIGQEAVSGSTLTSNIVKDSSISNVKGNMYYDNKCVLWAHCQVPSNLKILNCEINAQRPINSTTLTSTGSKNTIQLKSHSSQNHVSNINASNFSDFAGIKNTFNSHRSDLICSGIRHSDIRVMNITAGQILVSIQGNSRPATARLANIVVGDPVALERQMTLDTSGDGDFQIDTLDQCFKVAEVKFTTSTDEGVTGSVIGDLFLKLTSAWSTYAPGGVTAGTNVQNTTGDLLLGKVHCELQNRTSLTRFDVGGTLLTTGGGRIEKQIPGTHYNVYGGYSTISAGVSGSSDTIVNQLPFAGAEASSGAVQSLLLFPEATAISVLGLAFVHNGVIYAGTFAKRISTGYDTELERESMVCDGSSMEITKHNNVDGNALEFKQLTLLP
tara:strand:+ start:33907 stop:35871 length:1965 start_codon:yes stop_codon:yes gene_type:complete